MCTNFVPTRGNRLAEHFGAQEPDFSFREEAYPGYLSPIIRNNHDHVAQCDAAVFGLIPSWSKDGKNYRFCYNARSETVARKPSFRNAWRRNQFCIVPVEAIYEPCYETGKPVRWRIERANGSPMGLAGIWDTWKRPESESGNRRLGPADLDLLSDDWIISFSLLTINATDHPVMQRFHPVADEKRSVVILPPKYFSSWLEAKNPSARDFCHTIDPSELQTLPAPRNPQKNRVKLPKKPQPKLL